MPLETASYIHELDSANPASTDQLSQADDHIRLIKAALKATFPNINAPVTKTDEDLNVPNFSMPIGVILAWYGTSGTIPAGWALCNGQTVTRTDGGGDITTPNLVDKAIIGAGAIAAQGADAGAATDSVTSGAAGSHTHTIAGGAHTHTGTVQGHILTEAELPAHKHANGICDNIDSLYNHGALGASPTASQSVESNNANGTREGYTTTVGGNQAHSHGLAVDSATHTHTASTEAAHQHSVQVSTVQPSHGLHWIMKY